MLWHSFSRSLIVAGIALAGLAASPATAGPPWISIEYPPSPYDPTTRDAFLLVHSFHHGTPMNFPVTGSAEGIVNGQRRSVKLGFEKTSRTGTFALKKQWPVEGTWTLMITVTQGAGDGNAVTALVDIGAGGDVASVKVPTGRRGEWNIPKTVTVQEVDAALRARVARAVAGRS
ncbi:MAG: hypothetical protein H7Z74_04180 [Anaerolineae bacterium]|nr:hypothetical protein [Gemmatimonadaceae bacterium]